MDFATVLIPASVCLLTLVVFTAFFIGAQANRGVKEFRHDHHVGFSDPTLTAKPTVTEDGK
jgi:hypothetical protein